MIILPQNAGNLILPQENLIVVPNNNKIITSVSYEQMKSLEHFDVSKLNRK